MDCAKHPCNPLREAVEKLQGECFEFNLMDKGGRYFYDVCPFTIVTQEDLGRNEFNMGAYVGWDTHHPALKMSFVGGTYCNAEDGHRRSTIEFHCGKETKVVEVNEPNPCNYWIR